MRMAMLVLLVTSVVAGCATVDNKVKTATEEAAKVLPLKPTPGAVVLEVENFTLTKATIKPLNGASGGKTVVLEQDGRAEASVVLREGSYELIVVAFAPSLAEDAFYVSVGDRPETRLFPGETEKLAPSRPLQFSLPADGPCKVVLTFAEKNVQLDRVEIRPEE